MTARVAQVAWIAGCREQSAGARLIEEQWMRPRAGLMLGVSRTVVGDSLREYEQVALFQRGEHLVNAATPARQAPAECASTAVSDSAADGTSPIAGCPARSVGSARPGGAGPPALPTACGMMQIVPVGS
jgi:hypothetical protein